MDKENERKREKEYNCSSTIYVLCILTSSTIKSWIDNDEGAIDYRRR